MEIVDVVASGGATNIVQILAFLYRLKREEQKPRGKIRIGRIGGTSAGALGAIGIGFDVPEDVVKAEVFHLLQHDRLLDPNPLNLLSHFGLCSGEKLRKALAKLVGGEEVTLGDAKIPTFVVATDLYTSSPRILSSWEFPGIHVCSAGATSASVPMLFRARELTGPRNPFGNRRFVDGGVIKNFAMDVFDDKPAIRTIGVRVQELEVINPVRPGDHVAYAKALGRALFHNSNNAHLSAKNLKNVVELEAADGFDFSLSLAELNRRWLSGWDSGEKFLATLPG